MQGNEQNAAVEGLFERARESGAASGTVDDLRPAQEGRSSAFQGRARTLAGGPEAAAAAEPDAAAAVDPSRPIVHTITFYLNGIFTVDDGMPVPWLIPIIFSIEMYMQK